MQDASLAEAEVHVLHEEVVEDRPGQHAEEELVGVGGPRRGGE